MYTHTHTQVPRYRYDVTKKRAINCEGCASMLNAFSHETRRACGTHARYRRDAPPTHTHTHTHTHKTDQKTRSTTNHTHTHTEGLDTWPTRLCAAAKTFAERCPASGETFDVRRGTCNRIITHTRAQAQTRATHTLLRTRHHERCVSSQDTHDAS